MSTLPNPLGFQRKNQNGRAVILTVVIGAAMLVFGVLIGWVLTRNGGVLPKPSQLTSAVNTLVGNANSSANTNTNANSNTNTATPNETNTSTNAITNTNAAPSSEETSSCPDAGACNADAQLYCADEFAGTNVQASWKLDLVRCLYDEHKNDVSAECRESLECRQTLNENLVDACQQDRKFFCKGTQPSPGSEPLVDCLGGHFSELSQECADAWAAHDAAKPTQ